MFSTTKSRELGEVQTPVNVQLFAHLIIGYTGYLFLGKIWCFLIWR